MLRSCLLLIACSPAVICLAGEPKHALPIELDERNYAIWRDHILPSDEELAFQSLPWEVTFADGLAAAAEQHKPLLLWVMNGHPLGCT